MDDWGRSVYGEPCRECGFDWGLSLEEAVRLVSEVPRSYSAVLAGASPDLAGSSG